jgi:ActD protein
MLTETRVSGQVELHGLMAEFDEPEPLLEAARRAYDAGYRQMDAYAPMPVEGLAEAIGFRSHAVSRIVFWFGLAGACGGFGLCWWITVIAYPHIVGGRPLNSWPAYIPITFESMVLVACISAVVGMLWLNGLPQPYHPVFNVERFEHASRDKFFLCIEAADPKFDVRATREFLERLHPSGEVMDVAP